MTCFDDPGVKRVLDVRGPGANQPRGVVDPERRQTLAEWVHERWLTATARETKTCPVCQSIVSSAGLAIHISQSHDASEVFCDD